MNYIVAKRVYKDTTKLPKHAQVLAGKEIENIEKANNLDELAELTDFVHMEGTDEPYYRLKFSNYRYMTYYDMETDI